MLFACNSHVAIRTEQRRLLHDDVIRSDLRNAQAGHLIIDKFWVLTKRFERMTKSCVTLFGSRVETIVRCHFAGRFPYALNRIEFWTIRWKSEKLDLIEVFR